MSLAQFEKDVTQHTSSEVHRTVSKRLGRASEYVKQKPDTHPIHTLCINDDNLHFWFIKRTIEVNTS